MKEKEVIPLNPTSAFLLSFSNRHSFFRANLEKGSFSIFPH